MTLYHFKSDLLIWALFDAYKRFLKKVAQNMDVSETTISRFETGKNKPTNEKIALFTEICGQTFNFDLDRNLIMDRVYDIYDLYTDLKKEELNKTIQGFFFPT